MGRSEGYRTLHFVEQPLALRGLAGVGELTQGTMPLVGGRPRGRRQVGENVPEKGHGRGPGAGFGDGEGGEGGAGAALVVGGGEFGEG